MYQPTPIDTSAVPLAPDLARLLDKLAENVHEHWAQQRLREGWAYGPRRDDARKEHPCLVPFAALSEAEKEYDRITAGETLKTIMALGYRIQG